MLQEEAALLIRAIIVVTMLISADDVGGVLYGVQDSNALIVMRHIQLALRQIPLHASRERGFARMEVKNRTISIQKGISHTWFDVPELITAALKQKQIHR